MFQAAQKEHSIRVFIVALPASSSCFKAYYRNAKKTPSKFLYFLNRNEIQYLFNTDVVDGSSIFSQALCC